MPSVHPATEESRRLEDRHSAGRNCDRFSGPGVAGLPGLAMSHLERAESAELDAVASHERFLRGGEKNVDYPRALPPGDSRSGRIGDLLKRGRLWSSSSPQRFGQVLSLHSDNLKGRVAPASSPRPGQPLAPCERAPRPAPMPVPLGADGARRHRELRASVRRPHRYHPWRGVLGSSGSSTHLVFRILGFSSVRYFSLRWIFYKGTHRHDSGHRGSMGTTS